VAPDCPSEILVECNGASATIKVALDARERRAAFRFLYEVYVEREKLISPHQLSAECQATRSKWDKWDRRPCTRHIIALFRGEVVGHLRLLYRKDGPLPLEEDGFSISPDAGEECEASKLALHPEFRRADILAAFYRHIFHICRTEQRLKSIIFGCQPKYEAIYQRFGAVPIASFMNTQLNARCTVMRITFVDDYDARFRGFLIGRHHAKQREYRLHASVREQ
jgi:GNAT superfamily N-acetyltransferase